DELIAELVKQNHLTSFQARQIAAGKAKALVMGNYTILDRIGAGGMGQVFKAEHRRMHRTVAIKTLPSALVKDPAALARFEREVTAAAKLSHPNIVAAYDADEANGVHFLVMEYVEGQDLSATVKKHGPLPVAKALEYIRQAAAGLAYAHGEGIIHRDIKPANLLVDKKGTVKILDMGLARIDSPGGEASELTGTGAVMGTVDYMAPEQALNTKHADQRADIYSLGISLYYLLAGKCAYGGDTLMEKLLAHREQPIPSLKALQPGVPEALDGVFQKMVAKKIDERYQTMTDALAALEQCAAGLSGSPIGSTGNWQAMPTVDASELSIALGNQKLRSIDAPEIVIDTKPKPSQRTQRATPALGNSPGAKGPPWKNTKVLAGAGAAGFFALLLGVIVIIRGPQGEELARIEAPAGASVEVKAESGQPKAGGSNHALLPPGAGGRRPAEGAGDRAAAEYLRGVPGAHLYAVRTHDGAMLDLLPSKPLPDDEFFVTYVKFSPGNKPPAEAIGRLPELKRLDTLILNGCPIGDADLKPLEKLAALKELDLAYTEATATTLLILRNQHNITELSLIGSKIDPRSCIAFALAQRELKRYDGNWDDATRATFTPPATLRRLGIHAIDDKTAARVGGWTQLDNLSVGASPRLTKAGFAELCDLTNLQYLGCTNGTPVADGWLIYLARMPRLTHLWLNQSQVTDQGLDQLAKLDKLTSLSLGGTKVTSAGIDKLRRALPACKIEWDGGGVEPSQPAASDGWIDLSDLGNWVQTTSGSWTTGAAHADLAKQYGLDAQAGGRDLLRPYSAKPGDIYTTARWGDVQVELEFLLPKASNSGVFLMGEYEINLWDHDDSGQILSRAKPNVVARKPAGQWQSLSIDFQAPRFDGDKKITNARFVKVVMNDQVIHENVELNGVTQDGSSLTGKESATGPLLLQGKMGPIAFRNIRVRPLGATLPPLAPQQQFYETWLKQVRLLPAEQQIAAVSKKLMEHNPGFDGKLTGLNKAPAPKIENGAVTELRLATDNVTDISPLRALAGLKALNCSGSGQSMYNGALVDLSPLKGLPLEWLEFNDTKVADLAPLVGMPLKRLSFFHSRVSDLAPLKGMRLEFLSFHGSRQVTDLGPLRGMPLTEVQASHTFVADLAPLADCKQLKNLQVGSTRVTAATVAAVQKALPHCKISWDGPKAEDFTSLFNGRDLSGWKTNPAYPGNWRVENGVLVGSKGVSYLFTERGDFGDVHLRCEARVGSGTSAGIAARAPDMLASNPSLLPGYMAKINVDSKIDRQKTGSMYVTTHERYVGIGKAPSPVAADEWFTMDFIIRNYHIQIQVNGKTITEYTDDKNLFATGRIALQFYGGTAPVEFRKIEVRELDRPDAMEKNNGKPTAGFDANGGKGFVPLFNGRDLAGWTIVGAHDWKVAGGAIACVGTERTYLVSQRQNFRDFHLRVEAKINEPGNSGVYFRCARGAPGKHPEGYEAQISAS
ncbi:MAG TPA: family 16 glycoside hydrolase, partial [Pirellulales bacterium]|nr:family 16 glycoside hydrolase [Pirellulales bacterium]